MIKYKLVKGGTSIDFRYLEGDDPITCVSAYKAQNPEWADVQPEQYEEVPEVPAPSIPEQVTLWQLRGVLAAMGLEDTITTVVNSMPDSNEKKIALRAWEYANNIRRQSPTVNSIKAILNLTDEQTDQIFIQAEQIDA
jgi:hypothetical protein